MVSLSQLTKWAGGRRIAKVIQQTFVRNTIIPSVTAAGEWTIDIAPDSVGATQDTTGSKPILRKAKLVAQASNTDDTTHYISVNVHNHTQSEDLMATATILKANFASGVPITLTFDQNTAVDPGDVIRLVFSSETGTVTLTDVLVQLFY